MAAVSGGRLAQLREQAPRLLKKYRLPVEKVPSSLHDFGNTSGASLPLTISVRIGQELAKAGKSHDVLLSGFGIGLSWGTCLLKIENACFPELVIS